MYKLLALLSILCLSGCIWYVPDGYYETEESSHPTDSTSDALDFWFDSTSVNCEPDYYGSHWYATALLEGPWAYDVLGVDLDIYDPYSGVYEGTYSLYYQGAAVWGEAFSSWDIDCHYAYDFEFIAYDDYGNYISAVVYW